MLRAAVWGLVCCMPALIARADHLLDFSVVAPPTPDRHVLIRPAVSWEVRPDAATYCSQVKEHDGYAVWGEGCVHWNKSRPSCTIVTTSKTTHSLMGHLFLRCLIAGEPS